MILNKIWERYFLSQLLKATGLFLVGFYFLYFFIDYSTRSSLWIGSGVSFLQVVVYYGCVYVRHIDILLPFALLLATIKTLCSLNLHHELIALLASGIPLRRLLRPFVVIGFIATALLYIQFQVVVPYAVHRSKMIEDTYFKDRSKSAKTSPVLSCPLPDGSVLLYQSYDAAESQLFDVYWIRSLDDILRIKHLFLNGDTPVGHFVDHIVRDNGVLKKGASFPSLQFTELACDDNRLANALHNSEELSLFDLWTRIPGLVRAASDKEAQVLTWFYKRLSTPWLCLLVVVAPAPFCLTFTRQLRVLLIYISGLLGLTLLYLILNAATVVAQAQVIPPWVAVTTPITAVAAYFGWRYVRFQ